jgi:collagen type IX alpha
MLSIANYTCYFIFKKGPPGVNGMPGRSITDDEIRDICFVILREQLTDITANLVGPQGTSGPPGR